MILLGLGSNLGDREANITGAIRKLEEDPFISVVKTSSLYETEPIGLKEQPNFLNAVIAVSTHYPPLKLLNLCLGVEAVLGRVRTKRWGPRIIDIDILIYNDSVIDLPELKIPHPRLHERRFVLIPIAEIASTLKLIGGHTANDLLRLLPGGGQITYYGPLNWKGGAEYEQI